MCRQCSTRIGPLRAAPVSETGFRKKDVTSLPALEASNAAMLELLASVSVHNSSGQIIEHLTK